ncbi:MAG: DUF456 family protein [Tepidisphaerales bacterium]
MLIWAGYVGLVLAGLVGLALAVAGLPGIWLIVAGAGVYAFFTGGEPLGVGGLVTLVLLGVVAEVVEAVLGGVAAASAGGSKRGMVGAVVGGVVGAVAGTPLFPVLGTIAGACVGSFVGAFVVELLWLRRSAGTSLRIGGSAAAGKLLGILTKLLFGGVMLLVTVVWAFPLWAAGGSPAGAGQPTALPAPATLQSSGTSGGNVEGGSGER